MMKMLIRMNKRLRRIKLTKNSHIKKNDKDPDNCSGEKSYKKKPYNQRLMGLKKKCKGNEIDGIFSCNG